jgi:hypothetical protein
MAGSKKNIIQSFIAKIKTMIPIIKLNKNPIVLLHPKEESKKISHHI